MEKSYRAQGKAGRISPIRNPLRSRTVGDGKVFRGRRQSLKPRPRCRRELDRPCTSTCLAEMAKRRKVVSKRTAPVKVESPVVEAEAEASAVILISDASDDDCFKEAPIFKRVAKPKIKGAIKTELGSTKCEADSEVIFHPALPNSTRHPINVIFLILLGRMPCHQDED